MSMVNRRGRSPKETIVRSDAGLKDPEAKMRGFNRLPRDAQAMIKALCKPRKNR